MAHENSELRFERWRTRGDGAALSDIFATKKTIQGLRVFAYLREPSAKGMHASRTDANGHFRLVGLEHAPYRIVLDSGRDPAGENIDNYTIYPDENPAMPPCPLDLALPTRRGADLAGVETIQRVGRLRWEGQKVEARRPSSPRRSDPRCATVRHADHPAPRGRAVRHPTARGEKYSAWFWQPATDAKVSTDWIGSGAEVEAHDIDLP